MGLGSITKSPTFLWQACTKSLLVRAALKNRHLIDEAFCPCCEDGEKLCSTLYFVAQEFVGCGKIWDSMR